MNFTPTITHLKMFASLRGNMWMVNPEKAAEIGLSVIELSERTKSESYDDDWLASQYTMRKPMLIDSNKIAHIEIRGAMLMDGASIYERVGLIIRYSTIINETQAAINGGARGIIYRINSPGGTVSGNIEASKMVQNLSIPTVSYCEGLACSAAYKFAAGTDFICASESAIVGNIGTILTWTDYSEFFKKWGIETKAMTSDGAIYKSTFHTEPDDEQLAFLQESINESGREFRDHVTNGRAEAGKQLDDEVWKAGWYSGNKAGDIGLTDGTGNYDDAYSILLAQFDISQKSHHYSRMNFFKSKQTLEFEETIKSLQEQISVLENAEVTDKTVELTEQINILTKANTAIPELESKIETLESKIKTLESELVISAEKISIAAGQKLAAMGHGEPIELGNDQPTSVSRSAALTGFAKVSEAFSTKK